MNVVDSSHDGRKVGACYLQHDCDRFSDTFPAAMSCADERRLHPTTGGQDVQLYAICGSARA
jgi:hypothetical protein